MIIFIIMIFLFVKTTSGEEIKKSDSALTNISKVNNIINRDSITDSTTISLDTLPLCTLDISTVPSEATIFVDGKEYGKSPVSIKVDTGTHTIICQKEGFYQKRVVIQVPSYGRTQLSFKLTSPAKLKIVTEPPAAEIFINGEKKGVTPYTDSLFKPGKYLIKLEKEGYVTKEDSIEVESGGEFTKIDTLKKIVNTSSDETRKRKFSTFDIVFVGGAFLLFLLILGVIELKE
ncbi:MAG: PEGA domain-containing protein [Chitinispirillaceae bacterium]|nr:PEGA domain-containing protein [Chitinispirillaceae bacterium]